MRIENCFGTTRYEVKIAAADQFSNNNPFFTSRIVNSITHQLNTCNNMPKMLIIVLENDLIDEVNTRNREAAQAMFETYINYIMDSIDQIISHFEDILPDNAKRIGWPKRIFISPSMHRNYTQQDLKLRRTLADVMETAAETRRNYWFLKLVQVWEEHNINNVRSDTNQITNDGLATFWKAVDCTIRFCDKKLIRAEAALDNNPFKGNDERTNHQNDGVQRTSRNDYRGGRQHRQENYNKVWRRLDFREKRN